MPETRTTTANRTGLLFIVTAMVILCVPLVSLLTMALYLRYQSSLGDYALMIMLPSALAALGCAALLYLLYRKNRQEMAREKAERRGMEEELKDSERRLADMIDFLPDATFVIDCEKRVIIWNRAMEELTGVPAGDIIGKGDYEYALPFFHERRPVLIDLCMETDPARLRDMEKNYPGLKRSGESIAAEVLAPGTFRKGAHLWVIAQPLRDPEGTLIGAIESMRDVTERKLAEEKYATIFRLSPLVISISSVSDGKYLEVSDRFYELTGYTQEEVVGHTAFELNIWADQNDRDRVLHELKTKGRVVNEEIRFRAKSGAIRTMFFSAEIVLIAGNPCLLAVNADITERKIEQEIIKRQNEDLVAINEELVKSRNELLVVNQKLQQSEEKVSTAFHLAPVILTLSRIPDGLYVEVSDYFLKTTEYSREEVIGHTAMELNIWVNLEDRDRVMKKLQQGLPVIDEEIPFQSRSGKQYLMLFYAEVIRIFGVPHLTTIAVDITERKRIQEENSRLAQQLGQAQKMESIGRLAGGVAHDFNNLLTAILGNTELALAHPENREDMKQRLEIVKKAATSAAQLTRQLLTFSRKEIIEPVVIDINEMIERTQKMLSRLIGENIKLKTVPNSSGCVKADPGQIEQIIINLAVNARDAMPDGGTLIIRTDDVMLDEHYCATHPSITQGRFVMLSLSDTGQGMNDETKKNLFEPFYTTKTKGKGTGLGLAMVYGAVRQNNGAIEVYSVLGEGTTFKMYFPWIEGGKTGTLAKHAEGEAIGGNETILLVEDDEMVRDFAAQVLFRLGYKVYQASSGEDAIRFNESCSDRIHLLITDVILTGMNGKVLAQNLLATRPDLKVLFTSGYTQDIIAERGVLEEGINFIGKPYAADSLARKIREILD